jgi:hypothetical protein
VAEGGVLRNVVASALGRPIYRARRTDGQEGDE